MARSVFKEWARRSIHKLGYDLRKISDNQFQHDGISTSHNHDFMDDEAFLSAYHRGVSACDRDYKWFWRVHVGLSLAEFAKRLEGDFVECGVNRGFMSSAIMHYLGWDELGKNFYLMDTFEGIDLSILEGLDLEKSVEKQDDFFKDNFYTTDLGAVKENFSEWKNCQIIAGSVPGTLRECGAEKVAFIHLDMNCAAPEVSALEYFWDKLVLGGIVLLDDYGWRGHEVQKKAIDAAMNNIGVNVLSLPTGQGILFKT